MVMEGGGLTRVVTSSLHPGWGKLGTRTDLMFTGGERLRVVTIKLSSS